MVSQTTSILIDLDHAKSTTKKTTMPSSASSIKPEDREYISRKKHVTEDVALQALGFYPDETEASSYIATAQRANVLKSNVRAWSSKDIGWKVVGKIPDFRSHQPDKHERMGTLPFISHELLQAKKVVPHAAIHDMESFWWVLIYLCLTRKSGGGRQREDPKPGLKELVYDLFQSPNFREIHDEKASYFIMGDDTVFNYLLDRIHDYFVPLKSLLTRWRDVLMLGYTYKGYEYYSVHDYIVAIIDDTLKNPDLVTHLCVKNKGERELLKEQEQIAKEKELKRREIEYISVCSVPAHTASPVNIPQSNAQTSASMTQAGLSPPDHRRLQATPSTSSLWVPSPSKPMKEHLFFAEDPSDVQTKLALNVYGWPIKFFTDLKELLEGSKEAIIDHKHMYKANVLHRDVSLGNIILQPSPSNDKHSARDMVSETRGILIDLDHAKSTTKKTTVPSSASSIDPLDQKDISRRKHVDENVALQALTVYPDFGEALGYTSAAQRANVLESDVGGTWSSKDLGWKDVGEIPDFRSRQPDMHERKGTLPFISHQLLDTQVVYPHAAIHDMESFWWILVYLCLTRQSGGGHRREDSTPELERLVYFLFETENTREIHGEKMGYFGVNRNSAFNALLKTHIHDYFKPLKSLLTRWRDVLILGYTFDAYEYYLVHDYIVAIIDDTLKALDMVTHPSFQKDKHKQELEPAVIAKEVRPRPEEYASLGSIGRQTMYKVNLLARDVSLGTVILQPLPPSSQVSIGKMVSQTMGILIDSDHAKSTSKTKTISPSSSIKPEDLKYICEECNVSESVVLEALTFCSRLSTAGCYIDAAQTLNVLKSNLKCI